jgi:hypothetical protein
VDATRNAGESMTVNELLEKLQAVPDKTRDVVIVDPDDARNWLDIESVTVGPQTVWVKTDA